MAELTSERAYLVGVVAFQEGRARDDCPYLADTLFAEMWLLGFDDASNGTNAVKSEEERRSFPPDLKVKSAS